MRYPAPSPGPLGRVRRNPHQRPPGGGRVQSARGGPPGQGGPASRNYPRRPPYRCGGGPVRPGGAHRAVRPGGCNRPYLRQILRWKIKPSLRQRPEGRTAFLSGGDEVLADIALLGAVVAHPIPAVFLTHHGDLRAVGGAGYHGVLGAGAGADVQAGACVDDFDSGAGGDGTAAGFGVRLKGRVGSGSGIRFRVGGGGVNGGGQADPECRSRCCRGPGGCWCTRRRAGGSRSWRGPDWRKRRAWGPGPCRRRRWGSR